MAIRALVDLADLRGVFGGGLGFEHGEDDVATTAGRGEMARLQAGALYWPLSNRPAVGGAAGAGWAGA